MVAGTAYARCERWSTAVAVLERAINRRKASAEIGASWPRLDFSVVT